MSWRIKTVSERTGIPKNTLLAWERRYGFPSPPRTDGGYRQYTDEDVADIERVKGLIDQGLKISEALAQVRGVPREEVHRQEAQLSIAETLRNELVDALIGYDRAGAEVLYRRFVMFSFDRQVDEVLVPVLREVGERWHRGKVTVAQEHYATAWCREQLVAMIHAMGAGPIDGRVVALAGYPGEDHEVGLLVLALKLSLQGIRVDYLGANVPLDVLGGYAARAHPVALCQSVAVKRSEAELHAHALAMAAQLPGVPVFVGGRGIGEAPPAPLGQVRFTNDLGELLAAVNRSS